MNPSSLSLPSFAKINWSLRILGKRADGYHEVRTVLQTVSLHDDLKFETISGGDIQLSCDDPEIPTDNRNLIVRAANALRSRYERDKGVRIHLIKRVPTRAGLGGGSSNAAVALLALAHLWQIEPTALELHEIAAQLGADVPFFLEGGCALATGTGSTISPLAGDNSGAPQHLIIVTPNASVSTADAYAAIKAPALTTSDHHPILSNSRNEADLGSSQPWVARRFFQNDLSNDFEPVIFDIEPEIGRVKKALLEAGAAGALLAGSGSSVFGIFANLETQQHAVSVLKAEGGWRTFPCVALSREEYRRRMDQESFRWFVS